MKFVVQRVSEASVSVNNKIIGKIESGLLVLVGVSESDNYVIADKMLTKLLNLRIFEDENGKTNLNLNSVNGELLIISQFTLYADCKKGNRPSFTKAGNPDLANDIYQYIIDKATEFVNNVQTGEFGANMKVFLVNDGPFTILMDSDELFPV